MKAGLCLLKRVLRLGRRVGREGRQNKKMATGKLELYSTKNSSWTVWCNRCRTTDGYFMYHYIRSKAQHISERELKIRYQPILRVFTCTQPACTHQRRLSLVWKSWEQSQAALTVPQTGTKRGSFRNCPQMLPAGLAARPSPKTICSNFVQPLSR